MKVAYLYASDGKMRIQIIGAGTVGRAAGEGFSRFGRNVVFSDVDKEKLVQPTGEGFEVSEKPTPADLHFICAPEGVVKKVVEQLMGVKGLIVIRSTVPPGTTVRLMKIHERHISHNPRARGWTPTKPAYRFSKIFTFREIGEILGKLG